MQQLIRKVRDHQTWEYLEQHWPTIYKLAQKRRHEGRLTQNTSGGIDEFVWYNTPENHEFWSPIYNEGVIPVNFIDVYEKEFGEPLSVLLKEAILNASKVGLQKLEEEPGEPLITYII